MIPCFPVVTASPKRAVGIDATWSPVASMPTARFGLAVTTGKHGIIYAIGGSTGLAGPIVPAVEAYDQKTGSWSALAPLPLPRRYLMAATDRRGRGLPLCGARAGGVPQPFGLLHPGTDTWGGPSP